MLERNDINRLTRIQLLSTFWIALNMSFNVSTIIHLQGTYFSSNGLSKLILVATMIKALQVILNKLPDTLSLWLPLSLDVIWLPLSIYLAIYHIKQYIVTDIILGAVFQLFYYNRFLRITELTKSKRSISDYMSKTATYSAVAICMGTALSIPCTKYCEPKVILISANILCFLMFPLWVYTNKLTVKICSQP